MQLAICLFAVFVVVASSVGLALQLSASSVPTCAWSTGFGATRLTAPFLAAFSVCCALVVPSALAVNCHCLAHGLHHPHLCFHHPDYAAGAVLPAAIMVAVWAYSAVPKLLSLAGRCGQTRRWLGNVIAAPVHVHQGMAFRLVDAPGLGACTIGLLRPVIVIDSNLWRALASEERLAVLHHEEAHRRRRDPLSLLLLEACVALSLSTNARELLRRWRGGAEVECDRYAAELVDSPESVASALLTLERYHRAEPESPVFMGVGAGASALEARVRALLDVERSSKRPRLVSDALGMALAGFAAASVVTLVGGEVVHHSAETVLGLFVSHH